MSALTTTLEKLLQFLARNGTPAPTEEVLVAEIGPSVSVDDRGRPRLRRDQLLAPQAYERRFDELQASGFPWLNVNCCGVDSGKLIVLIEVGSPPEKPAPRTSLNFSGPQAAVLGNGWKAAEALLIE